MMVLSATLEEKNSLSGVYLRGNRLEFIEDLDGNWVVNQEVINDPDFAAVKTQLELLPVIEYVAKPSPPIT